MWDSVMFSSYAITNLVSESMTVEEWIYLFAKHMEEYQKPKVVSSEQILKVLNNNEYLKAQGRCDWTVLGAAVSNNNLNLMKYFISKDPLLVNSMVSENHTALQLAIVKGHIEAVKLLLELGAVPDLGNKEGILTCLQIAKKCGNEEIINLLTVTREVIM